MVRNETFEPDGLVYDYTNYLMYGKAHTRGFGNQKNLALEYETSALCSSLLIEHFHSTENGYVYMSQYPPAPGSTKRVDHVIKYRPPNAGILLPLLYVECKRTEHATSPKSLLEMENQLQTYLRILMNLTKKKVDKQKDYPIPHIMYGATFAASRIRMFVFNVQFCILLPMWHLGRGSIPGRGDPNEYIDVMDRHKVSHVEAAFKTIRQNPSYKSFVPTSGTSSPIISSGSRDSSVSIGHSKVLRKEMKKNKFAELLMDGTPFMQSGDIYYPMKYADKDKAPPILAEKLWQKARLPRPDDDVSYWKYEANDKKFYAMSLPKGREETIASGLEKLALDAEITLEDPKIDTENDFGATVVNAESMVRDGQKCIAVDTTGKRWDFESQTVIVYHGHPLVALNGNSVLIIPQSVYRASFDQAKPSGPPAGGRSTVTGSRGMLAPGSASSSSSSSSRSPSRSPQPRSVSPQPRSVSPQPRSVSSQPRSVQPKLPSAARPPPPPAKGKDKAETTDKAPRKPSSRLFGASSSKDKDSDKQRGRKK